MVDFGDLKKKAEDAVNEHGDQIKDGVSKAADAIADKVGHADKIKKAEDALTGLVDKLGGN